MSLKEAINDTVAYMDELLHEDSGGSSTNYLVLRGGIRTAIKMLEVAVKAAGDTPPAIAIPPEVQHFQMMQKAREEFRKDKNKEEDDTKMVLLVGGASDGDSFAIASNWPIGARTNISGEVYQLKEDGKLHYEAKKK